MKTNYHSNGSFTNSIKGAAASIPTEIIRLMIATVLIAGNASATSITFVEKPDGAHGVSTVTAEGWATGNTDKAAFADSEHSGHFVVTLTGTHLSFPGLDKNSLYALLEPGTNAITDVLALTFVPGKENTTAKFTFTFSSYGGEVGGFGHVQGEFTQMENQDGANKFVINYKDEGIDKHIDLSMQSDSDPPPGTPDGGQTFAMLGLATAGLCLAHARSRRKLGAT